MNKEEAINFLRFKKVFVEGKSALLQKKAFSLGWKWRIGGQTVNRIDDPFLFFEDIAGDKLLKSGKSILEFYECDSFDETSANAILNIVIDETNYRPFKDVTECWNEMLKHEPFCWIKGKLGNEFASFKRICEDNDYEKVFNIYTFADGTPFGLKED